MTCEGNIESVFCTYDYLEICHNAKLVLDPSYATMYMDWFEYHYWKPFYGQAKEAIPPDAPAARGKEVELCCYVDVNHAGDLKTHRLKTGLLIFLNKSPIDWYSKSQNAVEYVVFGVEFVAQKTTMDIHRGFHHKLCIMGIHIASPHLYVWGQYVSYLQHTPTWI